MFIEINGALYNLYQVSTVKKSSYTNNTQVEIFTNILTIQNGTVLVKDYASETDRNAEYDKLKALV